jgi:very-short-patch-repair endonuclease
MMLTRTTDSNNNDTPPPPAGGGWGEGEATPPSLLDHARSMRQAPTPAEHKLWQALRKQQIGGLKFRRQVPLGPFIADFYCPSARLVVEADGVTHIDPRTDERRDAWLKSQRYNLFRISNHDVLSNLGGVVVAIQERAAPTPPPNPLPQMEGEKMT